MNDKEAKTSADQKEWTLEVTQEQYEEAKAKGLDEETLFNPGKHTFRRRDPDKILSRDNKTVVLKLDAETYDYYKRLAQAKQSKSIEEEIHHELKSIAEKEAA